MIRGITFSEQMFYSADFAHFMNTFLCGGVGITKGCSCTSDGANVTIGTGYFVAHGRLMNVETAEVIDSTKGFQSGYNRIVYEIDLSKENSILEFRQGAIKIIQTESLVQENLDEGGKVYQFPFCHFQWSGTAITGFVVDAPTFVGDDILGQWSANYTAINEQFDAWFAEHKKTVEKMIADLQEQGYAKTITKTATIGTSWAAEGSVYKQDVTVQGILETDNPIVDIVTSVAGLNAEQNAWRMIFKAVTKANKITFYASNPTENAINVQIKVIR